MLARDWSQHKDSYDFVIVGSGYGGAIAASNRKDGDGRVLGARFTIRVPVAATK